MALRQLFYPPLAATASLPHATPLLRPIFFQQLTRALLFTPIVIPTAIRIGAPAILAGIWESILRAVPKKKTSHKKKRQRFLAGKALQDVTALNKCSACGNVKRAHLLCPFCVNGGSWHTAELGWRLTARSQKSEICGEESQVQRRRRAQEKRRQRPGHDGCAVETFYCIARGMEALGWRLSMDGKAFKIEHTNNWGLCQIRLGVAMHVQRLLAKFVCSHAVLERLRRRPKYLDQFSPLVQLDTIFYTMTVKTIRSRLIPVL